jgi:tRNA A37 threonylcarbamoyladenosine biosynthesis protein TsaE
MKIEICDLESDFSTLGDVLLAKISSGKNIVLLQGNLGAGKTTLVKRYGRK